MFSNVRNFLEWCHYSDRSKSAVICLLPVSFSCDFSGKAFKVSPSSVAFLLKSSPTQSTPAGKVPAPHQGQHVKNYLLCWKKSPSPRKGKQTPGKVIFRINTLKFVFRPSLPDKPDRHTCFVLGKRGERKYGGRVRGKISTENWRILDKNASKLTSVSPF